MLGTGRESCWNELSNADRVLNGTMLTCCCGPPLRARTTLVLINSEDKHRFKPGTPDCEPMGPSPGHELGPIFYPWFCGGRGIQKAERGLGVTTPGSIPLFCCRSPHCVHPLKGEAKSTALSGCAGEKGAQENVSIWTFSPSPGERPEHM